VSGKIVNLDTNFSKALGEALIEEGFSEIAKKWGGGPVLKTAAVSV
jgi:hypothetical protein